MQAAAARLSGFGLPEAELKDLRARAAASARQEVQQMAQSAADTAVVRMTQRCAWLLSRMSQYGSSTGLALFKAVAV